MGNYKIEKILLSETFLLSFNQNIKGGRK